MNCDRANKLLVDYIYRELEEAEVGLFEAHLSACAACARRLSSVRATLEVVHGLPRIEPPTQLTHNLVRAAADALREERVSILERLRSSLRFLVVHPAMTAAVTLVVVVGISFFAYQQTAPPRARQEVPLPEVSYRPEATTSEATPVGTDQLGTIESSVGRLSTELKNKEGDTTASIASRKQSPDEAPRDEERPVKVAPARPRPKAVQQAPMDNRRHVGTRGLWNPGSGRVAQGDVDDAQAPRQRARRRLARKPDVSMAKVTTSAPSPRAGASAKDNAVKHGAGYFRRLADSAMAAGRCDDALRHYNRALSLDPALSPVVSANVRRCAGVLGRGGEGELLEASKRFPMLARHLQGEIRRMRSDRTESAKKASRKAKARQAPAAVDAYK